MAIKRILFDWKQPALQTAAKWLAQQYGRDRAVDLRDVIVTVPGARAGRRLVELLVEDAERSGAVLVPPQIITLGKLPELLYDVKKAFAGTLAQQLAWVRAMRTTAAASLEKVVRKPPADDDLPAWLSLGQLLAQLHRELASDQLDFAKVARQADRLPGFDEHDRWKALAEIQDRYLRFLDSLELWDLQTARLFAVDHREFQTDCDIVLVGMVDLDRTQRAMLSQIADRVTALVFADSANGDAFDELGCLIPAAWQDVCCSLTDEQIEVVDGPSQQADAAFRAIADLDGNYCADEIVIGVPDKRVAPYLEQRLHEANLPVRLTVGPSVARTGPGQLLAAVAEFLQQPKYVALSALVRHPAMLAWLAKQGCEGDCLTPLDEYHVKHLPSQAGDRWLGGTGNQAKTIYQKVKDLLAPLLGSAKPLDQWGSAIADLLVAVYGDVELNREDPQQRTILSACEKIREVLEEHQQVHPRLVPAVSGAQAIRLALREMEGEAFAPIVSGAAIELLGWLELPLDDAPALIVTGFNESFIPAAHNGDLFLPNNLRQKLDLEDNNRRYARDIYYLNLLAASRKRLKVIAGRRSADNEPLVPSRLLLACDDDSLPRRTQRFFSPASRAARPLHLAGRPRAGSLSPQFPIPKPIPLAQPVEALKVTEFRDYLACPYRYYLRHRLELDELSDDVCELDAGQFGSLIHDVLKEFSLSKYRDSSDDREIDEMLGFYLDQFAGKAFGQAPLATVNLQVEQARFRLRGFARWQAGHRKQGWQIRYAEAEIPKERAFLEVDGQRILLRGRIDRIDHNPKTGEWLLLDYKTADGVDDPHKVHRDGDNWVDLQLPLYRHLAKALDVGEPLRLGYLVLPKSVAAVDCRFATWTEAELAAADEVAASVVRAIRLQKFWPPSQNFSSFDAFAVICQADQFSLRGASLGDDEEGA